MKKIIITAILTVVVTLVASAQTSLNQIILFQKDSVNIPSFQMAQMEMMADYFKAHPKELFFIGGFTSVNTPEEKVEYVCEQRANAVKKMLVEKYGVDGTYIIAIGVGVSRKSTEPDFNEKVEFFKQ